MAKFKVEIKETLSKIVTVEAVDEKEALSKAKEEYGLGVDPEYTLTADDFVEADFLIYDNNTSQFHSVKFGR